MAQHSIRRNRTRRGFTLLEVLLVLGLLVVVAGLAAPTVGLTLDSNRLRSSGDLVRASLAKARIRAMESGRTYAFRYRPGGAEYVIEAWSSPDDYLESSALNAASLAGGMAGGGAVPAMPQSDVISPVSAQPKALPESITFAGSETTIDTRAAMLVQTSQANQPLDAEWSEPIFFYADGTSSTARVVIISAARQRHITLTLRGLTGAVSVSRPTLTTESPL